MSDLPLIKSVASRAIQAGLLDRPKCHYCRSPLYISKGRCKNCGAPATPLEARPSHHHKPEPPPRDKSKVKRITPALFMK